MKTYNLLTHYSSFNLDTNWSGERSAIQYKLSSFSLINRYKVLKEKTKNNKLQDNSIIWFSPFTEFPLYKFKNYIDDSKLNITRSKKYNSTVDTVIINDKIIDKYFSINSLNPYRKGNFYIIDKKYYNDKIKSLTRSNNNSPKETNQDSLLFACKEIDNITSKIKLDIEKFSTVDGFIIGDAWGTAKAFQSIESFERIIEEYEQGNINIIFDEQINNDANGGLEFDLDLFSSILDMIGNNDEGNINIAREIIANTNLEQSKPYILFLFQLYPYLSKQNNTKSWKYVTDQFKEDKNKMCYDHLQLFISTFGSQYPEYIPTIFRCMAIYFNKQWKNEVIKEITIV
jgi:hypothetical protein